MLTHTIRPLTVQLEDKNGRCSEILTIIEYLKFGIKEGKLDDITIEGCEFDAFFVRREVLEKG